MKRLASRLLATLLLSSTVAMAQEGWRTPDGSAIPESETHKSKNGLAASLLITSDRDWAAKWDTPSTQTPQFTTAKEVSLGGKLAVLTFVANPQPDKANRLDVKSHITITRPDGTVENMPNSRCLAGKLMGPPQNIRLCEAVVQFSADPDDLAGVWRIKVVVTDANRATDITLESAFTLLR